MKKKLTSLLAVLLVFSFAASASAAVARWSYLSTLGITLEEKDDGIQWGATAVAYAVESVTAVKVDVKLQLRTSTGWLWLRKATRSPATSRGPAAPIPATSPGTATGCLRRSISTTAAPSWSMSAPYMNI